MAQTTPFSISTSTRHCLLVCPILYTCTSLFLDKPQHQSQWMTRQYPVWYGSISPSISPSLLSSGTRNSYPVGLPCKGVKLGAFPEPTISPCTTHRLTHTRACYFLTLCLTHTESRKQLLFGLDGPVSRPPC